MPNMPSPTMSTFSVGAPASSQPPVVSEAGVYTNGLPQSYPTCEWPRQVVRTPTAANTDTTSNVDANNHTSTNIDNDTITDTITSTSPHINGSSSNGIGCHYNFSQFLAINAAEKFV